jgi:hypothetical protein
VRLEAHDTADNIKYITANMVRMLRSICAPESTLSGRTGVYPAQFVAGNLLTIHLTHQRTILL